MALIKCPECGKEISDRAARCPKCGIPMEMVQSLLHRSAMNEIPKDEEENHIQYQQKEIEEELSESGNNSNNQVEIGKKWMRFLLLIMIVLLVWAIVYLLRM